MQTIVLDITKKGLRPKPTQDRNSPYAIQFDGLIPTEFGAKDIPDVEYIAATGTLPQSTFTADGWPFPHAERADKTLLLFGKSTVYSLSESTWSSGLTPTTLTPQLPEVDKCQDGNFSSGTHWSLASNWQITGGTLCDNGSAVTGDATQAAADQQNGAITTGYRYLVTYTVVRTAGSVTIKLGTGVGTARSSSGTYTEWITSGTATPSIIVTGAAFQGSVDNLSVTAIANQAPTYNAAAPTGVAYTKWHVAGFGDNWCATNGLDFLYKMAFNAFTGPVGVTYPAYTKVGSVVNHQNRLVMGGITLSSTAAASALWLAALAAWKRCPINQDLIIDEDMVFGKDWVVSSEIGGGDNDVPYLNILTLLGMTDASTAAKLQPIIISHIETGRITMLPLRQSSDVKQLKVLGGDVICYGNKKTSRLEWTERGYRERVMEVATAMGSPVAVDGIAGRDCVVGTPAVHMFITHQNHLMRATTDGVTDLDFSEWLTGLTLARTVGSYNPLEGYFTFTDNVSGYTFTRVGLGKTTPVRPTCQLTVQCYEGLVGAQNVTADPYAVIIESDIIDGGSRGVWNTYQVKIGATDTDTTGWGVKCKFRHSKAASFNKSSAFSYFDVRGVATPTSNGTEFQYQFYHPDRRYCDLERIEIDLDNEGNLSSRELLNA
jgi:hypothetical protein